MNHLIHKIITGLALLLLLNSCNQNSSTWQIDSPEKQIRVELKMQGNEGEERLYYSIYIKENRSFKEIMDLSPLGIVREDGRFVENLELISAEEEHGIEDQYTLVSGKQQECSSVYNTMQITFKNRKRQKISLIFRAYDNGIAFLYRFPGEGEPNVRVTGELTGFDFKEGNFWAHPYDTLSNWSPGYETYYRGPLDVGTTAPLNKNGWAFPILIESENTWMMVSEAGFDGSYGASHLHGECKDGSYRIKFAEQGEAEGYYENSSYAPLPWSTPWRFIAIGTTPREIVETNLPTDLSAPSALEDPSWIKPGRASWSWWSESDSPRDYKRLVPFVDLAAEMGWEYSLVDANWNRMKNGDVEKLVGYAAEKNVDLLLWYNSGGIHNVVTEEPRNLMDDRKTRRREFERISKLGISGIKVDFFQSDKQEIIGQYIEILEDAADFGLVVNFHGCTLPRGWRRTWPNLLTMEAVRGGENYKYASDFPEAAPAHLTILPFSRNAVGPCDYTPGGFSDSRFPHLTTYGFELALPVVIESGIMHHMDTPGMTLGLPSYAVDLLRDIPVVWDNTRYLAGYPGKEVIIARRSGDTWYIGGINGENHTKEMVIDLSVIGETPSSIRIITDGITERDLQLVEMTPENGKLTIRLKPYGGFAGSFAID
ncbi:MAG: glycoside hydrolase family 97 catalytic domain-containing protein [Bacteroidota bacterium]